MVDEVTKILAKTGDLNLRVKVEDGRLRVITSSMEHNLTLKTDEKLEITLVDGSAVLWRRPVVVSFPPLIESEELQD